MNLNFTTRYFGIPLFLSLFSSIGFAASCPSSSSNVGSVNSCIVDGSASNIQLNFISGFDSSVSTTPSGGNNGTTIGEQRRLAFIKAAELLANQIVSSQTIVVDASFSGLPCDASSAVLGSAGAMGSIAYEGGDILPAGALVDTFYPIALFNALENDDAAPEQADIQAEFNANLGSNFCLRDGDWYYGFDDNSGNLTGFLTVLLHEITHGLGFTSLVNPSTGEKAQAFNSDGSTTEIDDIFSNFLYIKSEDKTWAELSTSAQNNAKRKSSITSQNDLFWNGSNANNMAASLLTGGISDGRIQMYAPSTLEEGSSVSHFDTSATPNELMEPNLALNSCDPGLALGVMQDIGWSIINASKPNFYLNINCNTIEDGQTYTNNFNGDFIKIIPVSSSASYTFDLTYEGNDAKDLVDEFGNGLFINTRDSISQEPGEFAGVYVLTVTDKNTPSNTITITINRPLRILWSSEALLNNESYSLVIEGGAAGSVYDLTQNQTNALNFLSTQNQAITSVTASNQPSLYNPALVNITSNTVNSPLTVTTTVKSQSNTYADVSNEIVIYPADNHIFNITDSSGKAINAVSAELATSNIVEATGIERFYVSDTSGNFSINLPSTNENFTITLTKSTYSPQTIVVNSGLTTHNITLSLSDAQTTVPKFGSGGGGALPLWMISLLGLCLLRRIRP